MSELQNDIVQKKTIGREETGSFRSACNSIGLTDNRSNIVTQRKLIETMKTGKAPVQKKTNNTNNTNNTGLPDNLKSGIENLSGISMDDVKVHYNSSQPAQLNAHATAQGTNIHVAAGQEKHLPHEAWHVVQQKQGRVRPTLQMKGKVNVNDDAGLEKEADVMGAKALQRKIDNAFTAQRKTISGTGVVQRWGEWLTGIAGAAGGAVLGGIKGATDGMWGKDNTEEESHGYGAIPGKILGGVVGGIGGGIMGAITGAQKGFNRGGMAKGASIGVGVGGLAGKLAGGVIGTAGKVVGGIVGHAAAGVTSLSAGTIGAIGGLATGAIAGYKEDGFMGATIGGITGAVTGGAAGMAAGYITPVAAGILAGGALGTALGAHFGNKADERRLAAANVPGVIIPAVHHHAVAPAPPPAHQRVAGQTRITYTKGYITFNGRNYQVGKKMEADLWADDPVHGSATGDNWAWMQALNRDHRYRGANIVRGHLLNHDLGGIAKPENLYPISTIANVAHSTNVEQNVKGLLQQESKKGANERHVHYEVTVGEANAHDPAQAWFDCVYYVDGGHGQQLNRNAVRIDSDLNIDRGGFGGGIKVNPLSGTKWHHGKRRGYKQDDWDDYVANGKMQVLDESPGVAVEYPPDRRPRR